MSKLFIKKGFTLVEVLCSLGIFSIVFICMMSFDKASLNMKNDIKNINNEVTVMEAIKNNIMYSMSFEELEKLKTSNRIFVNKEDMDFKKIKTNIMSVFSNNISNNNEYMELSLLKDELNVYKLNLSLHTGEKSNIVVLQCNFYKGCHE